mgnify:CR=1 FL=1
MTTVKDDEAADALDIPVGTAKSRLHYAIEALRAALAVDQAESLPGGIEDRADVGTTGAGQRGHLLQTLVDRFTQFSGEGATITTETHDIVANDEHAIQLVTATATMGDKELVYRAGEIYHMRDGKITERWAFSDDTDRINKFFGGM